MAFPIPSMLLKQLYTFGSLKNSARGVEFQLKNRLSDATVTGVQAVAFDGVEVPLNAVSIDLGDGQILAPGDLDGSPIDFPLRRTLDVVCAVEPLSEGKHAIEVRFSAKPFGTLKLKVDGAIAKDRPVTVKIPRNNADDYTPEIIEERQRFVEEFTGQTFEHIKQYSFDAHATQGNIEHFTGVAQVPIGFAGPLTIHGEHAQGDFIVPMATTEGTLVASYNRGMKVLNLSGGVKVTIADDAMQRAPVFVFDDARAARDFVAWAEANLATIAERAEATSSVAKLQYIDSYLAGKFAYLRFNYTTGDAAGQNMVGRATFAACGWILDNYQGIRHFYLESNLATDKKASQVNLMKTRQASSPKRRSSATCSSSACGWSGKPLHYRYNVSNVGSILSGASNNGLHSANGITAMFIATGNVANVAESSAGIIYTELTPGKRSLHLHDHSLAHRGDLRRQHRPAPPAESLELLGCYRKGKKGQAAEIIGSVVLAGEISLASAISSSDWVSA
ncbi:MAG: hydroxymethylglutaryl-CoA reductase [Caldilineaceae bacterium]